jgi:DNA helicase-4
LSIEAAKTWGPTEAGKAFTTTPPWRLTVAGSRFELVSEMTTRTGSVLELKGLKVSTGIIWASIEFPWPWPWRVDGRIAVDGISNLDALYLSNTVTKAIADEERRAAALAIRVKDALPELLAWSTAALAACEKQLRVRGWLTKDFKLEKPEKSSPLHELMNDLTVLGRSLHGRKDLQSAVGLWRGDYEELNSRHLSTEKTACSEFFARIESRPLTDEQVDAVVCFDKRVLVVAAAGSGKTSTMVAKAGYAVHKGYVVPESILLLAFNNDAASELRVRLKARLEPLGLETEKLTTKTFHAFGLEVIGAATGKRPSLAPWLEAGDDLKTFLSIAEELRANDHRFCMNWDLLRIVFGQDLPGCERWSGSAAM